MNPGTVTLAFTNQQADPVTALVLAVPSTATAVDIVTTCNDFDSQLEPVGSIPADPGSVVYLPLMELPPGRYAIITGPDPCLDVSTTTQIALLDIAE